MSTLILIFATAFVFAIASTPIARRVAWHVGVIDVPSERKVHAQPMPLLGGIAIYAAFILALLLFEDSFFIAQIVGILIGATWVSFLGTWDDRVGLSAWVKLMGQVLGGLILIASGVTVELTDQPIVNIALTLFWVVGITNAMNLLDNVDGLCGGVAAIASAFFLLISLLNGQFLVASMSAAILGASIGFLIYNFNPASIFMGDAGTLFLGFILAVIGIKLRFLGHPVVFTWFIPILVLGLPIFDTTLVFISRLRRGLNPLTTPGVDHLSHRLIERGWTRREAVLLLYLAAVVLGVLALFCAQALGWESYILLGMATFAGLGALWKLELKTIRDSNA
jgi:UDP-GlcNAc:undecaprenyl-phosphate/decaprenyl-phosphate GlcNAc-1-phosphate transferase